MAIVITGGCGFIGLNLLRKLLEAPTVRETEIRIVDNLSTSSLDVFEKMINETGLPVKHADSSHNYVVQTKTIPVAIELVTEDVTDIEFAKHICKRCSVVIHLAAQTAVQLSISEPNTDFASNVIGTFNYLEASRQNNVPTFITASSSAVIGNAATSIEDLPLHPISPYGASKAAVEAYCSSFYHSYGIYASNAIF